MNEIELPPLEQVKLLEDFIFNNEELEALESIVDKFNIFSSLGIINQEIRHSNFLAWLIDPNETHNLSEYFTTSFLKLVTFNNTNPSSKLTMFDVDTLDLANMQVFREWNNIDVLLVDEEQKLACVIENKVDNKEHSNQLKRYRELIELHYPDYKTLFVFLTVHGEEAEKEKVYIPVSYREVSGLITNLLARKESQLSDEVNLFIRHYNEMIKRYIMEESEVQELCEQLYKKHKKALDLIFKHKPDVYNDVRDALEEIIDENASLEKDHCSKSYVRFLPKQLDFFPKEGDGWTKTKRMLLFEIQNYDKAVDLFFIIGPGTSEVRQRIYDHVKDLDLFNKTWAKLPNKWASIYKLRLSTISKLEGKSKDEIKEVLQAQLDKFFSGDYPKIESEILKLNT
jgi:hypothetical protein